MNTFCLALEHLFSSYTTPDYLFPWELLNNAIPNTKKVLRNHWWNHCLYTKTTFPFFQQVKKRASEFISFIRVHVTRYGKTFLRNLQIELKKKKTNEQTNENTETAYRVKKFN